MAIEFRIIGGTAANITSMPYQASIRERDKPGRNVCGGAIVAATWIVTAAHCFRGGGERRDVVVGATCQRDGGGVVRRIGRVVKHPDFAVGANRNSYDLALLELTAPIEFDAHVRPVRLPAADQPPPVGARCAVAGWGRTARDRPGAAPRRAECLRAAELPLRSRTACLKHYVGRAFEDYFVGRRKCMICAGDAASPSVYRGDSGSGLVCDGVLYGIASFGIENGRGEPTVFADVYTLRPFIEEHLQ